MGDMDKKNNNLISLNYGKLGFTADFSIFEKLFNKMIHPKITWQEFRTSGVFLKKRADCREKVIKSTANWDEYRLANITEADLKKDFNMYNILRVIGKNNKINDDSFEQIEQKNPDFLDNFRDMAQNYSSDYMQELWATLLSKEIEQPNSFSVASMLKLKSMNKQQSESFEKLMKRSDYDDTIITADFDVSTNIKSWSGIDYMEYQELISLGLITKVNAWHAIKYLDFFQCRTNDFVLINKDHFFINSIFITSIGKELLKLLNPVIDDERTAYDNMIKDYAHKNNLFVQIIKREQT